MKLRFRKNSLRLRVNQVEVEQLAVGQTLAESVSFAGGAILEYILTPSSGPTRSAHFDGKSIRITAPLHDWVRSPDIGFYFEVEPGLKIAIEKDLECVDGPAEEQDPHAYPRAAKVC
jgi:hypothetical protein